MAAQSPTIELPDGSQMLSDAELLRVQQIGSLYQFLRFYAKGDRSFDFDDFTEFASIASYPFAVANNAGAGATSFALPGTAVRNGVISGTTGTTSGGNISLIGPLIYRGVDNAGMEARFNLNQLAGGYNIEIGFIDAVPAANASGVTDVDTPAAAFTNGAVMQADTSQTINTAALVTKGNAAGQVVHTTTPAATPVLVAGQYHTVSVCLRRGGSSTSVAMAVAYLDGRQVAVYAPSVGAVNAATLLAPWIYVRSRSVTPVVPTVDYIARWADRGA